MPLRLSSRLLRSRRGETGGQGTDTNTVEGCVSKGRGRTGGRSRGRGWFRSAHLIPGVCNLGCQLLARTAKVKCSFLGR